MDPPPKPASATTSLFQVFLRLRPPIVSASSSVPSTPSKSLYPTLPSTQAGERFLAVEPPEQPAAEDEMPRHITIHPPSRGDSRKRAVEKFAFTKVFEEGRSQLDVFHGTGVQGVVEGVLKEGRDGLVATLGVTGSGKTHTMLGSKTQRGLTQLSLDLLFRSLAHKTLHPSQSPLLISALASSDVSEAQILSAPNFLDGMYHSAMPGSRAQTPMTETTMLSTTSRRHLPPHPSALPTLPDISDSVVASTRNADYAILISMYEVYNDRIFDLLTPQRHTKEARRRPLLFKSTEGSPDRKVVAGLKKVVCGTYEEALMVLETGLMERRVAGTGSNSVSSRSHGFFCVEVKKRARGGMAGNWSGSHLTIVDLAGSERARNAKTAGATLAEAGKINESLMYLGQCLQMQSDSADNSGRPAVVPFRQCKLTELLFSNSFPSQTSAVTQGSSQHHANHPQAQRAVMIVTADPLGDFNATSQILRYSALAREVTVPRIPSVASLVFEGKPIPPMGARSGSGRNSPDESVLRELEVELSRMQEQLDVAAMQLAEERVRRREAEAGWRRAETRLEEAEQSVREEVWAELETRLAMEQRRWLNALGEEADRFDARVDRKLDLLKNARASLGGPSSLGQVMGALRQSEMNIFEDASAMPTSRAELDAKMARLAEAEAENVDLVAKVRHLEAELAGRSPSKQRTHGSSNVQALGEPPVLDFSLSIGSRSSPAVDRGHHISTDSQADGETTTDSAESTTLDMDFDKENSPAPVSAAAAFKALRLGDDASLELGDVDSADEVPPQQSPTRRVTRSSTARVSSPLKNSTSNSPNKTRARGGAGSKAQRILTPHLSVAGGVEIGDDSSF